MNELLILKHNHDVEFETKIPNGENVNRPRDVHISIKFLRYYLII